jgi:transposase
VGFREVTVIEVREVLRGWLEGAGLRTVAERAGVDRKTARRYVVAAQAAGLERGAGFTAVDDDLVASVVSAVRPARPNGHGTAWEALEARHGQVRGWLAGDGKDAKALSVVKVHELLARQGCVVPYRTLHRFAVERCGFRVKDTTVRVVDGDPGVELQIDFGHLGYLTGEDGRRRKVHALIFTACYSRHLFVWLTYSQTLVAVIAGCEAAWAFFGGVFKVIIPDNMKAIVTDADAVNPRLSQGWLDYAQHVGFGTDPARVRSPKDKPKVERAVQYVRGNFWAGEAFTSLEEAQERVVVWCADRAGMRIHGTLQARPLEVFNDTEAGALLPVPAVYDVPVFKTVKVHRDFHVEVGKALYSVPGAFLGDQLDVRADSELVKLYHRGRLIKTHPRQRPGGRSTDREDLPKEKAGYALRDLSRLIAACATHGNNVGIYAERLLDDPLPWTRMRTVYRLLGLVRRYGAGPVEAACSRALDLDVVSVTKIASMLERATEDTLPLLPVGTVGGGRFARTANEFTTRPTPASTGTAPAASSGTVVADGGTNPAAPAAMLTLFRDGQPVAVFHATELLQEDSR